MGSLFRCPRWGITPEKGASRDEGTFTDITIPDLFCPVHRMENMCLQDESWLAVHVSWFCYSCSFISIRTLFHPAPSALHINLNSTFLP